MKKPLPTYMPRCFTRKLISVKSLQKRVMALLSMEISSSVHLGEWDTWTGWGVAGGTAWDRFITTNMDVCIGGCELTWASRRRRSPAVAWSARLAD